MATLEEIREKLKAIEEKKAGNRQSFGQSLTYPFWNIKENTPLAIRFLPDADEDNIFFWKERQLINLKFPGVKGADEHKEVTIKVPCVEMWGDTCPVHVELRPWFKDDAMEDLARQYWKKRTYLFQGFVIDNPIEADAEDAPENPIRRFQLGPQIFNIVKDALMDKDMESIPVDYINGVDFRITRTKKGQYNDYSTSKWSRKETELNVEQLEAIEKYGLFNINDWMPKKPSPETVNIIFEMFEASVEGELYDPERWAKYYRPWGLEYNEDENKSTETKEVKTESAPETDEKKTVEEEVSTPVTSTSAQDILEKIRARAND